MKHAGRTTAQWQWHENLCPRLGWKLSAANPHTNCLGRMTAKDESLTGRGGQLAARRAKSRNGTSIEATAARSHDSDQG